jgi:hypothetical protein
MLAIPPLEKLVWRVSDVRTRTACDASERWMDILLDEYIPVLVLVHVYRYIRVVLSLCASSRGGGSKLIQIGFNLVSLSGFDSFDYGSDAGQTLNVPPLKQKE